MRFSIPVQFEGTAATGWIPAKSRMRAAPGSAILGKLLRILRTFVMGPTSVARNCRRTHLLFAWQLPPSDRHGIRGTYRLISGQLQVCGIDGKHIDSPSAVAPRRQRSCLRGRRESNVWLSRWDIVSIRHGVYQLRL